MKILLTGCNGQLGTDLRLVCEGVHEVVAHDTDLDITDRSAVAERVAEVRPDLLINAAAYNDVDAAEDNDLLAYRVNALGPQNLALACQATGVPLMHISTDFVFNGEATAPYTEFDRPDPRSVYAKSKYAGEQYVSGLLDRYYLVRTSWLFGVAGRNFVKTIIRRGREQTGVRVVDDQMGCPTYSRDLAAKLLEIAATGAYGYYHVSNSGNCTWNRFARDIYILMGIKTRVYMISTRDLARPAPRPRFSVMRGLALEMQGIEPMRHYHEAVEDFLLRDLPAWEAGEVEP